MAYTVIIRCNYKTLIKLNSFIILHTYKDGTFLVECHLQLNLSDEEVEKFIRDNISDTSLYVEYEDENRELISYKYNLNGKICSSASLMLKSAKDTKLEYRKMIMQNDMLLSTE